MKVLLDEMLPAAVAELLPEEDVTTARAAGYGGLSNGGSRMVDILPQAAQLKAALRRVTKGAVIRIE